jgi:hypothetical protein
MISLVLICFAADAPKENAEHLASMRKSAESYKLSFADGAKEKAALLPEPVLRWTNPLRDTQDGAAFLWIAKGRPEAIACIYRYQQGKIDHEFQSLSPRPLRMVRSETPVWEPREAGVEFKPLSDSGEPAADPVRRLAQMRGFARRFTAKIGRETPHELRLLTQPLHRYGDPSTDVVDGGLFAFVQGTDPELILLIEARRKGNKLVWEYAAARMTMVNLELRRQGAVVWTIEWWNQVPDPAKPYITFRDIGRETNP